MPIRQSLNVELPKVQDRRVDLVLLLADASLLHIEFQSSNRRGMPLRMAEYYLLLLGKYKRPIRQFVLYVGSPRMRMEEVLEHGPMRFSYTLKDIREWPADDWLESDRFADHVLAILGATSDARKLVRRILERLKGLQPADREAAIASLAVLSGLRRFETILRQEARGMDVVIDWRKNEILRELYEEGLEEGREQGLEQGREQGRDEGLEKGLRMSLLNLLSAAFGKVPSWAAERVSRASAGQLKAWQAKVLTAKRIEDVIRPRKPAPSTRASSSR